MWRSLMLEDAVDDGVQLRVRSSSPRRRYAACVIHSSTVPGDVGTPIIGAPIDVADDRARIGPRRSARSVDDCVEAPRLSGCVRGDSSRVESVGDPELLERPGGEERGDAGVLVGRGDEQVAHALHRRALEVAQLGAAVRTVSAPRRRARRSRRGRVRRGGCPRAVRANSRTSKSGPGLMATRTPRRVQASRIPPDSRGQAQRWSLPNCRYGARSVCSAPWVRLSSRAARPASAPSSPGSSPRAGTTSCSSRATRSGWRRWPPSCGASRSRGRGARRPTCPIATDVDRVAERLEDPTQPDRHPGQQRRFRRARPAAHRPDSPSTTAAFDVMVRAVLRAGGSRRPRDAARGHGAIINVAQHRRLRDDGRVLGDQGVGDHLHARASPTNCTAPGVTVTALLPGLGAHRVPRARRRSARAASPTSLWLDAERLVRAALRDVERGKVISIPSVRYKVLIWLPGICPEQPCAAVVGAGSSLSRSKPHPRRRAVRINVDRRNAMPAQMRDRFTSPGMAQRAVRRPARSAQARGLAARSRSRSSAATSSKKA